MNLKVTLQDILENLKIYLPIYRKKLEKLLAKKENMIVRMKKMRKNITARQPNPFNMRYRFSVNSESIRYHRIATAKPPMPKAIMNASETTRKT